MKNNVEDILNSPEYIYIFSTGIYPSDPLRTHLERMAFATIVIEKSSGKIIKNRFGPTDADVRETKNKTTKVYEIVHEEKYDEWTVWMDMSSVYILAEYANQALEKYNAYIQETRKEDIKRGNWKWRLFSITHKFNEVII